VVLSVSAGQLRALRLRAQLLSGPPAIPVATVATVAAHLAGLQAQAAPPARLAIRARSASAG
jgi:hypothetical protein